ncbi:MAG: aldehyde ferredoxin oxidoreductase family protein [Dehalococcoidia bacterium]|jgi:aldehyde:ferredoxin oxidoreductase|nr:aldehyde ferredoxin oxidoreductase family protein [Dehalococcoidia bacterium]
MSNGYNGKVLRVNLTLDNISVEEPEEEFFRRYYGGSALSAYYLLKEMPPGADPLGPANVLVFAPGAITGAPVSGCGRNTVGAKSPLTGGFGDAQVGGYWGAELKFAGFDAIVITGRAASPVYLYVNDGQAELKDANELWGKTTLECQEKIRQDLGDSGIKVAQIGPGGENLVRYACIINDLDAAAGRTGMGAVMGSKNLKAVAVRGRNRLSLGDDSAVKEIGQWFRDNVQSLAKGLQDQGTPRVVRALNRSGILPTRNFNEGTFEGADKIGGAAMNETILVGRHSCYACAVQCKREVKTEGEYQVNPRYGGPEYETIASTGSDCGIDDLPAIAKANELCQAYGLDTISCGASIAFAMECVAKGILTKDDLDGLDLSFGNAPAMVEMVRRIAMREGLGDLLAEGVARASKQLGPEAEALALHVKGQEIPMHEPRLKQGLGLGYAVSPTGADHCHNIHDNLYQSQGPALESLKDLGIIEPVPATDLSPAKVRMLIYSSAWEHLLNSLVFCNFVGLGRDRINQLVQGVTGWESSLWELMKVGERVMTMARAFNMREGLTAADDKLPRRFFTAQASGPIEGIAIDEEALDQARLSYYGMMGWDEEGVPTPAKLAELDVPWVADAMRKV